MAGVEKAPLVVHLPGFNEETVPQTPLLELYEAGVRYRKALSTLVMEAAAGQVRLEQIEAFLQRDGLTLDAADAWLAAMLGQRSAGLASVLEPMSLPAVIDDLLARATWPNGSLTPRTVKSSGIDWQPGPAFPPCGARPV